MSGNGRAPEGPQAAGDQLVLIFVPPLVTVLMAAEKTKGAPLTEDEVTALRDGAACMAVKFRDALAMEDARGWPDIMPERAWKDWQAVRAGG